MKSTFGDVSLDGGVAVIRQGLNVNRPPARARRGQWVELSVAFERYAIFENQVVIELTLFVITGFISNLKG